jgi:hypothetical protein
VVKFITNHHKPLALYRKVAEQYKKDGPTELVKYAETRFASKIMMLMRYQLVHPILEKLLVDDEYSSWLRTQKVDTREKGKAMKSIVHDVGLMQTIKLCIRIMEPCLTVLRLTDGKTGATLSNVYAKMLDLDVLYRNKIPGIAETARKKIHAIFMARWHYFHTPLMTAAYRLTPEYCRLDWDPEMAAEMDGDIKQVFAKIATPEHPYAAILSNYSAYEVALKAKTHDLTSNIAFSKYAQEMPSYQWANTYFRSWPHLRYVATRLLSLSCSASGCEHSWSLESWVHSKKRNRLSQRTVESLVRTHTNLLLEAQLESEAAAIVLPWDQEMEVDEPEEDEEADEDEDGDSDY